MEADWRLYQLALFNVIQNSVKFNNINGKIHVQIEVKKIESDILEDSLGQISSNTVETTRFMLETTVTDTGIGIEQDRLGQLFKVFGELK